MELKEFEKAVGHILGLKGEVKFALIRKNIVTGEVRAELIVIPTKAQREKIMSLIANNTG